MAAMEEVAVEVHADAVRGRLTEKFEHTQTLIK